MGQVVQLAEVRARRERAGRMETKRELGERWRVSERTIERWMKAGLPFHKPWPGGAVRFPSLDCDDWLSRRRS